MSIHYESFRLNGGALRTHKGSDSLGDSEGSNNALALATVAALELKANTVDSVHAVTKLASKEAPELGADDILCLLQHHPSVRSIRHSYLVPQGLWTKYHSSTDIGRPFGFTVGAGNVVLGLDEAVSTMRVGE